MRTVALLLLLVPLHARADGSEHPLGAVRAAPFKVAPRRFEIHMPKDRGHSATSLPSNTPERLVDFVPNMNIRMDGHAPTGKVLQFTTADLRSKDPMVAHVIDFARSNGLTIHETPGSPGDLDALKEQLKPFGADHLVVMPTK